MCKDKIGEVAVQAGDLIKIYGYYYNAFYEVGTVGRAQSEDECSILHNVPVGTLYYDLEDCDSQWAKVSLVADIIHLKAIYRKSGNNYNLIWEAK